MTWKTHYRPPNPSHWTGRSDSPPQTCFFQNVKLIDLTTATVISPGAFVLLGFCSDEGIKRNQGRPGARLGPLHIRRSLSPMPQPPNTLCYDAGDICCDDHDLEAAQSSLAQVVHLLLEQKAIPILLGGGHEIAWGHYQGIAQSHPKPFGIINFDAHFDLRPLSSEGGTSGTPFLQIAQSAQQNARPFAYHCIGIQPGSNTQALFASAKEHQVEWILAETVQTNPSATKTSVEHVIKAQEHFYVSICLDVFAAPYAPGVSAPQPLGLTPWQVLPLLKQIIQSGKVLSFDLAELSPPLDIDERTAKLAAHIIFYIIASHIHHDKE